MVFIREISSFGKLHCSYLSAVLWNCDRVGRELTFRPDNSSVHRATSLPKIHLMSLNCVVFVIICPILSDWPDVTLIPFKSL